MVGIWDKREQWPRARLWNREEERFAEELGSLTRESFWGEKLA
jgi:hypothetical protein